jgi:hypothetical protein
MLDIDVENRQARRPLGPVRKDSLDDFSNGMFKALGSEFAMTEFRNVLEGAIANKSP